MSDWPADDPAVCTPLFVSTFSRYAGGWDLPSLGSSQQAATITWPVANTAFYVPIALPFPYEVKRVFWVNGSSITSTNMDFGIYAATGTKLYSTGSTAASGASVPQYTTPSPGFVLPPGRYYFALADSSTTSSRGGQGSVAATVARLAEAGVLQQASALPLPASMTGAAVANAVYPLCGITRTASGFA